MPPDTDTLEPEIQPAPAAAEERDSMDFDVVIVGGGHFGSFVPYPQEVTPANTRFVFQEMECYHCFWRCHRRANKFQLFPCIGAIAEDQVLRACESLLKGDEERRAVT